MKRVTVLALLAIVTSACGEGGGGQLSESQQTELIYAAGSAVGPAPGGKDTRSKREVQDLVEVVARLVRTNPCAQVGNGQTVLMEALDIADYLDPTFADEAGVIRSEVERAQCSSGSAS